MRWTVHAEEPLYTDEWLDIRLADVEIPGVGCTVISGSRPSGRQPVCSSVSRAAAAIGSSSAFARPMGIS